MRSSIFAASGLVAAMLLACMIPQGLAPGSENIPWGLRRIHANCVWDNDNDTVVDANAYTGNCTRVAVIDTGIDYYFNASGKVYHPDLVDNLDCMWSCRFKYDVATQQVYTDYDYKDYYGHGTHVAGIVAAVNNTFGVIGVAPRACIIPLSRQYFPDEGARANETAAAINYAHDPIAAKVIVLSCGLNLSYPALQEACDNAYAHDITLVAAAGNDGIPSIDYPANYSSVIAVGAVYENGSRCSFSNYGSKLEFVAPGYMINSTHTDENYREDSGTSMACSHVAAVAALIWSSRADPEYCGVGGSWNSTSVRLKLRQLACDLGAAGKDDEYGYGLINAWAPLQRPLADVNNDRVVEVTDLAIVTAAYGSYPGQPNWDPKADITGDNAVDIVDSLIGTAQYGKYDP